jgi:hypothetical protein
MDLDVGYKSWIGSWRIKKTVQVTHKHAPSALEDVKTYFFELLILLKYCFLIYLKTQNNPRRATLLRSPQVQVSHILVQEGRTEDNRTTNNVVDHVMYHLKSEDERDLVFVIK